MTSVLVTAFVLLMLLSVPIAITLGLSAAAALHSNDSPLIMMAQSVFEALDSFGLMAIPFFVLAGTLMQSGGIARRLVDLANALVGWIQGGLGACVVLTSMFFATMSGSSSATTAAIGSVLIPAMEKKGYPRNLAGAITASAGELGVIIPPSIPMIIYALSANVSVADLFLAGILPGILIGLSLIATVYVVARVKGVDIVERVTLRQWSVELIHATKRASLAILMPVLILGGIYGGVFTPTEASVIAVIYGMVIGLFVYKELKWKDMLGILGRSAITASIILLIVGFAAIFAYVLTINQIPHRVGAFVTSITTDPLIFLLAVNVLLIFTGMFMETLAAIIILAPILAPAAALYGIDPVHFGAIMVVNLAVGMVTPPLGVNLFIVCQIANVRLEQLVRPLLIFLAVLIIDVLLITYLPWLTTWFR